MEIAEAKMGIQGIAPIPQTASKTEKPVVIEIEGMASPSERQIWADIAIHFPAEAHRLLEEAQEQVASEMHAQLDESGVIGAWRQRCIDAKSEMLALNLAKTTYFEFATAVLLH